MPSYLVTGASRGIGFAFLQQLSEDPSNIVVGLARKKTDTESKVAAEIPGRKNISVVEGDITSLDSLKNAYIEVKKITGDSLDVLIANAAFMSTFSQFLRPSELFDGSHDIKALTDNFNEHLQVNVIGNVQLFTVFLPLIKNGKLKKVVTLSSGFADDKLTIDYGIFEAFPYSVSKAAMNTVTAKFQAEFKDEGIIFMSISPGAVNTGHTDHLTSEMIPRIQAMGDKFAAYAPQFKGSSEPLDAVRDLLFVINNASIEANGGQMVSQFGNKQWL